MKEEKNMPTINDFCKNTKVSDQIKQSIIVSRLLNPLLVALPKKMNEKLAVFRKSTISQCVIYDSIKDISNITKEFCAEKSDKENSLPKIKYRPQRGTYKESMKQTKEFYTEEDMFEYIVKNNGFINDTSSLFIGDEVIYDKRNAWNTRYVMCNNYAGKKLEDPICIGMCDMKL